LSIEAAVTRAKEHALEVEVVKRDGVAFNLRADVESNRVRVAVDHGIVTAITSVG
jgi:hypothetical protein